MFKDKCNRKSSGPRSIFHRVVRGLAGKFNLPRKVIIGVFVIGLFINFPLTVILFFTALYWIKNPGKLEQKLDKVVSFFRDDGAGSKQQGYYEQAYAGGGYENANNPDDDFEFSDLHRQFNDLAQRAGKMEAQVASNEYSIKAEINKMKKKGSSD